MLYYIIYLRLKILHSMFFKAHSENKIGYKRLSPADLGLGASSNQTHIGLYDGILTFLNNQDVEQKAMFIYEDSCDIIDCYFDRIENQDGSFRSPKIRKGSGVSIVTIIRDLASRYREIENWYLVWFGLESEEIVFYLFNNQSYNFNQLSALIALNERDHGRIEYNDQRFETLIDYLESIVNNNSTDIISELEILSQIGNTDRRFKRYDIDKANKLFKEVGQRGECLIAEYLDKLKHQKEIEAFNWYNENSESGLPYDFTVQDKEQNITYIDVKSTSLKFEQPIIFSNQEIGFITGVPLYEIYRVYDINEQCQHLRICDRSKDYMSKVQNDISKFEHNLHCSNITLRSAKLAIPTGDNNLYFKNEILL